MTDEPGAAAPDLEAERKGVLEHWNKDAVESMYDKHLLQAEIRLISRWVPRDSKVLDAGCGEGEGTRVYAGIPGVVVHGADFADTRLKMAARRLRGLRNVTLKKVDFLDPYELDRDYDVVVSQRFLINIPGWRRQQQVLAGLLERLRKGGTLVLLEGSQQGVAELNAFRALWGLAPIPVKWHNYFVRDDDLKAFMRARGAQLLCEDGLGAYFMLTRGVRPVLDKNLAWDCPFNRAAASEPMAEALGLGARFSRLRLWVFRKGGQRARSAQLSAKRRSIG